MAAIRTDFDPTEKWDSGKLDKHAKALNSLTVAAGQEKPDVVLWPEAALPLSTENAGYVTFLRGNVSALLYLSSPRAGRSFYPYCVQHAASARRLGSTHARPEAELLRLLRPVQ